MPEVYKSSDAANNIKDMINAMADAQKSQIELKKSVMLKQIGDKMDLEQQGKEQIQKQNISFNMPGIGGDAPAASTDNGLSPNSGTATGATPGTVGAQPPLPGQPQASPMASVLSPAATPAQPQAPAPMTMANPAQQPANNAQSQMSMAPAPVPAGIAIPSPIGKPLPPPQGKIIMGQDGKPALNPNFGSPDSQTYAQIYNKWKSGQPLSSGESQWIKNKFNNDQNGNAIKAPAVTGKASDGTATTAAPTVSPTMDNYDKVRIQLENKLHMPAGSMWFNPSSNDGAGGWEINPIVKSRIEKEQAAQAAHDVRQPDIDFEQGDKLDKLINPTVAPTRSVLGLIGQTTVRAQRAIDMLNNRQLPITPQMLSGLGSDMAGILQGGAPTQIGMNEQQYNTFQSMIAKATQYVSQHPQEALPEPMRQQMLGAFTQLNNTGKSYIMNNINSAGVVHKDWIERNPEKWSDLKDSISQEYGLGNGQSTQAGAAAGMVTMTSPDGKQYTFSADQAAEATKNGWK